MTTFIEWDAQMSKNNKRERELEQINNSLRAELKALQDRSRLSSEEVLLLQILSRSPFTVWACDREFKIVLWNKKCEEVYGFSKAEALGKSFIDLFVDGPEKSQAKKDATDIIERNSRCENFLAYDNDFRGDRRTMLTNCFRVTNEAGACFQAEIGIRIDADLSLERHKLQTLRELGTEEQTLQKAQLQIKRTGLADRLEGVYRIGHAASLLQINKCEAYLKEIGIRDADKISLEILMLKNSDASIYRKYRELDDKIRAANSIEALSNLESGIVEFEKETHVLKP